MRRPGRFRVATESGHRAGVARKGVKEPCSGWLATADADLPSLSHGDRRARGDSLGMRGLEGRRPSGTGDVHPSPSGARASQEPRARRAPLAARRRESVTRTRCASRSESRSRSVAASSVRHGWFTPIAVAAAARPRCSPTSSGAVLEGRQPRQVGAPAHCHDPTVGARCPSSSISTAARCWQPGKCQQVPGWRSSVWKR